MEWGFAAYYEMFLRGWNVEGKRRSRGYIFRSVCPFSLFSFPLIHSSRLSSVYVRGSLSQSSSAFPIQEPYFEERKQS